MGPFAPAAVGELQAAVSARDVTVTIAYQARALCTETVSPVQGAKDLTTPKRPRCEQPQPDSLPQCRRSHLEQWPSILECDAPAMRALKRVPCIPERRGLTERNGRARVLDDDR